jgi:hypothetical protein
VSLDDQSQPGHGDAADYCHERDRKYGKTELKLLAVGKPQTDSTAATPSLTTFRELMQLRDIVPGQSQMPQVTTRQGSSQQRQWLETPQADNHIVQPIPAEVPDLSEIWIAKPVQPVSFNPCI